MVRLSSQKIKHAHIGIAVAALLALSGATGGAFASRTAGLSGAYLKLPVGATALALGGAYTAQPDYLAPWWNPAVLALLRERRTSVGAGLRSLGRTDGYGSFEFRVPPRAGMGVAALYRGDPFVNDLYDVDEMPLGKASYTTLTLKVALSYIVTRSLSAGLNIGILYQRLPTTPENGMLFYSTAAGIGAIDLAFAYRFSDTWNFALVLQNANASMNWEIVSDYSLSPTIEDKPLPVLTIASRRMGKLRDKPLVWLCDVKANLIESDFSLLDHPEATINTGWEWRNWENFYVRAGIGDVLVNGDIVRQTDAYFDNFAFRLTGGFSYDMSRYRRGLKLNYGLSTDKVWAGIDQQLDMTLAF